MPKKIRSFYVNSHNIGSLTVYVIGIADDLSNAANYTVKGFSQTTRKNARAIDKGNAFVSFVYNGAVVPSRNGKSLLH